MSDDIAEHRRGLDIVARGDCRAGLRLMPILVAILVTGCIRQPAVECDEDSECFVGEICEQTQCVEWSLAEPQPPPAGPLGIDKETWQLRDLELEVSFDGIPHLLVEESVEQELHYITWDGFRWTDEVILAGEPLSDLPNLGLELSYDGRVYVTYVPKRTNELHLLTRENGDWTDQVIAKPNSGLIAFGPDLAVTAGGEPVICYSLVDLATVDFEEEAPLVIATPLERVWALRETEVSGLPGCAISTSDSDLVRVFTAAYQSDEALVPNLVLLETNSGLSSPLISPLHLEGEVINAGAAGDNLGAPVIAHSRFDGFIDEALVSTFTSDGWVTRRVARLPEGRLFAGLQLHTHPEAPGLFEVAAEAYADDGAGAAYTHYAVWGPRLQAEDIDPANELEVDWFDLGVDIDGTRHPMVFTLTQGLMYLGPR